MLEKLKYKKNEIYTYNRNYLELGKNIVDNNLVIEKVLKDTKRNYVCVILYKEKKYILKEPRNEYIIPQRKIFSIFKKGESVTTLVNLNYLINIKKIENYSEPLLAVIKRKHGMICFSALIMEYIEENKKNQINLNEIVKLGEKIHLLGRYHGDFNPSNFILSNKNEIKIIDTQGKRMLFGNYRAHYDMLTMKIDSYNEMEYPYKKNVYYYVALVIKKIKKNKFIIKIKNFKRNLREKGWRI